MPDPVSIATERIRLVRFEPRHITPEYIGWLNDRDLMRYSNQRFVHHTEETCRAYLSSFENSRNLFLAVERIHDGRMIGTMTAYFDVPHNRADIGILIGESSARGCGYGTEAWVALMRYLFEEWGVRKITAGTMSENIAMCRLAAKAGMIPDGVRNRHNLLDDREVDVVHFAAFRGEWTPPTMKERGLG